MNPAEPKKQPGRGSIWPYVGGTLGVLAVVVAALVWFWDWNWFRPLVEARASASLGRPVTIDRLGVHLGRITSVSAFGVKVANPSGFQGADFATIGKLTMTFEPIATIRTRHLTLLTIDADQPNVDLQQTANGQGNWPTPPADNNNSASPPVDIGAVSIQNGAARVHVVREQSDVTMTIATGHGADGDVLVIDGKGTHARQPITFHAVGGALLSLRDPSKPYPVDFALANGETRITLKGHIQNPIALTGADLNLVLSGPNMALLLPLTGIATPDTPSYKISGRLNFADKVIKFSNIVGRVGSSDLNGELDVDPRGQRPILSGELVSHKVDVTDLGGFIGSTPGRISTPGQTQQQVEEMKRAEASPKLLPTRPISLPKVRAADVHLTYRGESIIGKGVPFDSLETKLDIDDGHIRLRPLRIGMGKGQVTGTIDLAPVGDEVDANVEATAEKLDIGRLLATAGLGHGAGSIDASVKVKGKGASFSGILSHGDGEFRAVMGAGGDINALLVDLMGLEVGKAFLAAIGVPDKEGLRCAVLDFVLRQGILASRALEVNTTDHVVSGGGRIDLSREVLEMTLRTDPKHFSIGTLSAPIQISGAFKDLHYGPAPELAVRAGAAIGLGILFPPAAILPTIHFGVGEGSPCAVPANRSPVR